MGRPPIGEISMGNVSRISATVNTFGIFSQELNVVCLSPRSGSVVRDVLVSCGFVRTSSVARNARYCSALLVFDPLLCLYCSDFCWIEDSDAVSNVDVT